MSAQVITSTAQEVTATILNQLGGRKFVAMTGSKNFTFEGISEHNKNINLRMDLSTNKSGANRLEIHLMTDDTYTMKFYKLSFKNRCEAVISKEQTFDGVYCDMLQSIFTQVTGMHTSL